MSEVLPIDSIRNDYVAALAKGHVVVAAPTGSGKSTRLPLWSREQGPVLVVEPRRVACTALAEFVATQAETGLGEGVGYAIRFEQRLGAETEVVFVTPGIALRWLEQDSLAGFATVILDEFHERRWDTDLLVALLQAAGRHRLVMTSATLAARRLADYLGGELLEAEGRSFPVTVAHAETERRAMPALPGLEARVSRTVKQALGDSEGDILVFLPGRGEIRACEQALNGVDAEVLPLHASVDRRLQRAALAPAGKRRRVILATNVAETSLTIPGVTTVIDSGLERRTSQRNGRTVLSLAPISKANAEQRRGRAGRVAPGRCIRLWGDLAPLAAFTPPEIQREQLTEPVLAAAAAGWRVEALDFPDPLPEAGVQQARERLAAMRALDKADRITEHGRALFSLPIDTLFAHLITAMPDAAARGAMVDLAAALGTRPALLRLPGDEQGRRRLQDWEPVNCDAWTLVAALRRPAEEGVAVNASVRREARRLAKRIRATLDLPSLPDSMADVDRRRWLRAMVEAAPERVFLRRARRRHALGNGETEVTVAEDSRFPEDDEAAVVLDEHSVPAKQGTRKNLTVATCLAPVPLSMLIKAGLGEARIGQARMNQDGRPEVVSERVYANRVIERTETVPTGAALREAVAKLILAGRCLAPAGERLHHDLAQWELYVALGHDKGEVPEAEAWLRNRLEELGLAEADDLTLVEPEDLVFPGIPEWEREPFDRQYPRHVSLHDLKLTVSYQARRRRVILDYESGTRKAEPKRWELPSWSGWQVVYRRGSKVVEVR